MTGAGFYTEIDVLFDGKLSGPGHDDLALADTTLNDLAFATKKPEEMTGVGIGLELRGLKLLEEDEVAEELALLTVVLLVEFSMASE